MYTHTNEPVSLVLLHPHAEGNKRDLKGTSTALGEQSQTLCSYSELTGKIKKH